MSTKRDNFTEILIRRQILSPDQLAEARALQRSSGGSLADALLELGYVTAEQIMQAVAESHGLSFIDLTEVTIPAAVVELVPECVARENIVLPLAQEGGVLTVALADPDDLEVVQKLQFILNKDIRPVLAWRGQIIEAINRHYGQTETESVSSMLADFTDTAIDFSQSDFARSDPIARSPLLEREAPEEERSAASVVERRATVRYYHRMSPERMYPLLVILSGETIREVVKPGVSQARSKSFEVAEGSLVEVEPVLPGCSCYPPKEQVRVERGEVTATFWVVPRVLGRLMQARVVVRREGATLAEVPLRVRVARQGVTVVMGALSLVLPFVLLLLRHFRLDFESQLQEDFGLYAHLANWVVRSLTPEWLTGLLLGGTGVLYLWLRPRRRDVFWDVTAVGPEDARAPAAPSPVAREPEAKGVEQLQGSLLDLADRYYNARDYAAALPCYERALGLRRGQAVHYSRASLAAFRTGDTARALDILRRAMEVLPAAEMRGSMWYNMGCFAARLGRFSEALRYLNRAVDAGYDDPEQFRRDPDLGPLRWHAGFKALLAGLG